MKNKKEYLARIMSSLRIFDLLKYFAKGNLIVINYHRIRPDNTSKYIFDENVFGPTLPEFDAQIRWLKENFKILSEDDLAIDLESKIIQRKSSVLITFDDGYRDIYTSAYPVLRKYEVPAIFFIPTKAIETRKLHWWDILSYFIKTTKKERLEFSGETFSLMQDRSTAILFLQNIFELTEPDTLNIYMEELFNILEVRYPGTQEQDAELVTWEQVKEIAKNNIAIGSHTHSHPVLSKIDDARQNEEFQTSKDILENIIQKSIRSLAYPIGGNQHFNSKSSDIAKQVGYKMAFSFNTGINNWGNINKFEIKRIEPPPKTSLLMGSMLCPSLFIKNANKGYKLKK